MPPDRARQDPHNGPRFFQSQLTGFRKQNLMMLQKRRSAYARFLLLIMGFQILAPAASHALSGGPSQPEFQSFEPIATSEMVNLPSGDFTYNIPLINVSGSPINMAYHSGITADMEATTVG